ncbi:MAG TPA: glycosyltransferase family 1 protein [Chloroflexus aurantiacus]|jgi:alpha-1,3-rhamnosyl/mannosyltransferase|uniref:Glycosyl transferase group 1 n=1 Tax=Chloroflexus aurantiacus (strain ATCC 29366 / DSM 635 / J-10-fl) TaxID=324602 RepID=A9WCD3_CHLAA|nr:glycosyltransferase family 1 protein [Chloroflexus aurantiacus]ABY34924.1 glycosyl transferase group 1 [Chloroflexus aurantiacus J-10-fl]RMG45806.1 MAG: glycosyltransferase family 1 protein [Chloroflexota bacterium]HBW69059.1 glycosyltransferase family 1 protein [Chloroflexus aurantiacus]
MQSLRIGFDARYIGDHFPGIGRYITALLPELSSLSRQHHLFVLVNADQALPPLNGTSVERITVRSTPFALTQQLELPLLATRLQLDVLHSPYIVKPYLLPCPSVVTIYDVLPLRYPTTLSPRGRRFYRLALRLAARSARSLITISTVSRDDLAFHLRIPRERIVVTPLAAAPSFTPQPVDEITDMRLRYGLPRHYVLYVGSNKPHKNIDRLLRAWERVIPELPASLTDTVLVIAGKFDPRYPLPATIANERGLSERVKILPGVSDDDLPALYSGALLFVFPSSYEGFGLPPLEAMACGTPVVCAYAGSLPEVVGEAALTVDPHNMHEIAEGILRVLRSPDLARFLRERGQRQAARFSWRATAQATLDVYEHVAAR